MIRKKAAQVPVSAHEGSSKNLRDLKELREIGNLSPNNRRQRRTCYALCHTLYPVSAAHTSIFRMDSNSTSYEGTETSCMAAVLRSIP